MTGELEQVDAAIVEHLRAENERLETENKLLKEALERPIQVMPPYDPSQQQIVDALRSIGGTLGMIQMELQKRGSPPNSYPPSNQPTLTMESL